MLYYQRLTSRKRSSVWRVTDVTSQRPLLKDPYRAGMASRHRPLGRTPAETHIDGSKERFRTPTACKTDRPPPHPSGQNAVCYRLRSDRFSAPARPYESNAEPCHSQSGFADLLKLREARWRPPLHPPQLGLESG